MKRNTIHTILKFLIAAVWLGMGLFCKVLNWVPRHQEIVASILGAEYAPILTTLIGLGETFIAFWILSGIKSRWVSILQIILVGIMNLIEFFSVPDLLLWGQFNIIYAFGFIILIYYFEFILGRQIKEAAS